MPIWGLVLTQDLRYRLSCLAISVHRSYNANSEGSNATIVRVSKFTQTTGCRYLRGATRSSKQAYKPSTKAEE